MFFLLFGYNFSIIFLRRKTLFYQIRYTKTTFTLEFTHDTTLPPNKVSALRGGMGNMLLNANCIEDQNCNDCGFTDECLVQRMMYSKFHTKPDYVTSGESAGYVFECDNYKCHFKKGDSLSFNLLLFGKSIVYFSQYIQAFFALGQCGLGKNHSHYIISKIQNENLEDILNEGNIFMEYYQYNTVEKYIRQRTKELLQRPTGQYLKLIFLTPTTIKYKGKFISHFDMDAILSSISRRIEMLNYYEDHPVSGKELLTTTPTVIRENVEKSEVKRYSSRHNEKINLHGIKGEIDLTNVDQQTLSLLLAGEILHIGKNTSFGFGQYRLI